MTTLVRRIDNPDELRQHLMDRNEAGLDTTAVGHDSLDVPFIAHLIGQYADIFNVYTYDPWDFEIDVPAAKNKSCTACSAHGALGPQDLSYPVHILVAS
jgi:hypothetical protein